MKGTLPLRRGFARLLPAALLIGFCAAPLALIGTLRTVPALVPAHDLVDFEGQHWRLADIPENTLIGLDLQHAAWPGVDLHGATFVYCDFRGCDLRGANLQGVTLESCDLREARLDGAEMRGASCDAFTLLPDARALR